MKNNLKLDLQLIRESIQENCKFLSENIIIPEEALKIEDLAPYEVVSKIDSLFQKISDQINAGQWPSLHVPIRKRENTIYDNYGNHFLGKKMQSVELWDKSNKLLRILRVAALVKEIMLKNKYLTKRECFYAAQELFQKQRYSDSAIDDLATIIQTRRKSLNIIAVPKGTCVGKLKIQNRDEIVDIERLGIGGWRISSLPSDIEIIDSDAHFILAVEKNATLTHLSKIKFWNTIPCIIITSGGQPDFATREFLKQLVSKLKIPVFGLFDSDPWGIAMAMNYAFGNVLSAHETPWFSINNFYWLGVMIKDLDYYNIPRELRLPMSSSDMKRTKGLLKALKLIQNDKLKQQIELMHKNKEKVEIQTFSKYDVQFLSKYLIEKIESGDLIRL